MSVLIRGMQMPEGCIVCPFAERMPPGRTRCLIACRILAENYNAPSHNRPGFCPLVDLESHGDLIDRNEFLVKMNLAIALIKTGMIVLDAKDDKELKMELKTYLDIRDGLKECDVVIEAEGAEE